jgi:carbamoylphosphate synthase small subunit
MVDTRSLLKVERQVGQARGNMVTSFVADSTRERLKREATPMIAVKVSKSDG